MATSMAHGRCVLSMKLYHGVRSFAKERIRKLQPHIKIKETDPSHGGEKKLSQMSFRQMCALRRQEAERSVLIQVPTRKHIVNVYSHIKHCGNIRNIFYVSHLKDYALIETESPGVVQRILATASHFSNAEKIPVESRVLHLSVSESPSQQSLSHPIHSDPRHGFHVSELYNCHSVCEQIELLYEKNRLTDLGCRLRFFVCSNLEEMLSGLFPQCSVMPFGSTVNGFGKHDCDLDMTLELLRLERQIGRNPNLKFMTKKRTDNERGFTQRSLQTVADVVEQFVPLCVGVQRILNARVPIVKFRHEACNIECDLSFSHSSGPSMSELLWMWSDLDPRVRPLVFCVRHWARVNELTRRHPGPWVSNFMLTALVVFFLQSRPQPVLPPVTIMGNGECRDLFSVRPSDLKQQNTEMLSDLLREFFSFYSTFDFHTRAMSVIRGESFPKPDFSPVHIENPLDTNHNISKNINTTELERLRNAFKGALWGLESSGSQENEPWGLMRILVANGGAISSKIHVAVGDLFSDSHTDKHTDSQTDKHTDSQTNHRSSNAATKLKDSVDHSDELTNKLRDNFEQSHNPADTEHWRRKD